MCDKVNYMMKVEKNEHYTGYYIILLINMILHNYMIYFCI